MLRTLLAATVAAAMVPLPAAANGLDAMRWQNRIIVLSDADPASPALGEQERLLLMDEVALRERDIVVLTLAGDDLRVAFGDAPRLDPGELRRILGIPDRDRFLAVLVGKDGGVKWTASEPTALNEINAVIDAMPMRRSGRG